MKKYKTEKTGLDAEIKILGIQEYIEQTDKKLLSDKRHFKSKAKKIALLFGAFSIGALVTFITKVPWFLVGGVGVFGVGYGALVINDLKDEMKVFETKIPNNNVFPDNFEKDESQINIDDLGLEMKETKGEKYYSDDFKKFSDEYDKNHQKDLKRKQSNLKMVDNTYYKKDEAISKVVNEIDLYYKMYKLPPFMLTDKEWKKLVDTIYDYASEKEYFNTLIQLVKFTLADALVSKSKKITLKDFVRNLCYVDYLEVNSKLDIKNRLNSDNTIISFSDSKEDMNSKSKK